MLSSLIGLAGGKTKLIAIVVVVVILSGLAISNTMKSKKIDNLIVEKTQIKNDFNNLMMAKMTQDKVIEMQRETIEQNKVMFLDFANSKEQFEKTFDEKIKTVDKLNDKMASSHSVWVEKLVNKGTKKVFKDIEELTDYENIDNK